MQMGARDAALAALEKCRRDDAWSGAAIDGVIKTAGLEARDAALAARLCLGVLQNSRLCDFYIDCYCSQNAKKLEPKLRDILRLGVYQLLFLDKIPARAAVNESVALCRACGLSRAAGLANAVLRRVSENISALPDIPNVGSVEHLSIKYSHPEWLVSRLIEEQGYAFTEDFLRCCNTPPSLDIQVNTLKVSTADYIRALARTGTEYKSLDFPAGCIELHGGSVQTLPGYEEGLFYVQDAAARAAVEIAAPGPGMTVLDACSAPGGKAFSAALRMENAGRILACDIHEKKLRLIRQGAERLGIEIISAQQRDARVPDKALEGGFDLVIADVPCSGLGVIRKKPEIRTKSRADVEALPQIQLDILSNLSHFVRPGGVLLYSTCTVLRAENEGVVERFLEHNRHFAPAAFTLGPRAVESGMYTFWPNVDGTDGFFAAKLIRKA